MIPSTAAPLNYQVMTSVPWQAAKHVPEVPVPGVHVVTNVPCRAMVAEGDGAARSYYRRAW